MSQVLPTELSTGLSHSQAIGPSADPNVHTKAVTLAHWLVTLRAPTAALGCRSKPKERHPLAASFNGRNFTWAAGSASTRADASMLRIAIRTSELGRGGGKDSLGVEARIGPSSLSRMREAFSVWLWSIRRA